MVPSWCHGPDTLRREPPPRPRRRRRRRRRGRACARRAPCGSARVGGPADAARRAVRSRRRHHGPSSPPAPSNCGCAPASPGFVVTPAPADEPRRGPLRPPPGGRRRRDCAHQPAPARAAQGERRAGRRPRAPVGQHLARPRDRHRRRAGTAARRSAAGALATATAAGSAERRTHEELWTPPNPSPRSSTSSSATSASAPASATPPSSTCGRATRPARTTSAWPSKPASTWGEALTCSSRHPSCARGRSAASGGSVDVTV